MKARHYRPAQCVDCGRFTRTLCIPCSMPLCQDHAEFPICADCTAEAEREELIEEYERSRAEAEEEDRQRVSEERER